MEQMREILISAAAIDRARNRLVRFCNAGTKGLETEDALALAHAMVELGLNCIGELCGPEHLRLICQKAIVPFQEPECERDPDSIRRHVVGRLQEFLVTLAAEIQDESGIILDEELQRVVSIREKTIRRRRGATH